MGRSGPEGCVGSAESSSTAEGPRIQSMRWDMEAKDFGAGSSPRDSLRVLACNWSRTRSFGAIFRRTAKAPGFPCPLALAEKFIELTLMAIHFDR